MAVDFAAWVADTIAHDTYVATIWREGATDVTACEGCGRRLRHEDRARPRRVCVSTRSRRNYCVACSWKIGLLRQARRRRHVWAMRRRVDTTQAVR